MKKTILSLTAAIAFLSVISCEDDGGDLTINQTITNNNGDTDDDDDTDTTLSGFVLSGETLSLDASLEYSLNGPLIVRDGGTLSIPAGTKIVAQSGADIYIAVMQGGKIEATGTSANPITLTSATKTPGAWGGLILLGKAPINAGTTATSEIGGFTYGGTDETDNSGTVQYVVIEYSGGAVDASSENNGFSFYGVGNGTTIDHIESYYGSDDGIEFFGGTANVSHVVLIGNEDDSLDWTEGFSGSVSEVYIKQEGDAYDKAIEADGFNPDVGINVTPTFYSNPTISNVTIEGLGSGTTQQGGQDISSGSYEAVRLREATQGTFTNMVINGYGVAYHLKGNGTTSVSVTTGDQVLSGELKTTTKFTDVTTEVDNDSGVDFSTAEFLTVDSSATGTEVSSWASSWAVGL